MDWEHPGLSPSCRWRALWTDLRCRLLSRSANWRHVAPGAGPDDVESVQRVLPGATSSGYLHRHWMRCTFYPERSHLIDIFHVENCYCCRVGSLWKLYRCVFLHLRTRYPPDMCANVGKQVE